MKRKWKNSWFPAFLIFITKVKVPSKEMIEPGPITLYGAQERFLIELDEALASGQFHAVCLKARQLGMTTILLLLDIFWCHMNPGLQGAIIADTSDNREIFRSTITTMLESLPPGFRIPVKSHNRNALTFANGSRIQYMQAGTGKNSGLGRSRAFSFLHASEMGRWGDQKGIDTLKASLATHNPNRLYIWESTALGLNAFYDLFQEAKNDPEQRAFFIGWWSKELYRIEADSSEFQRWWLTNPVLDELEQAMALLIEKDYGHVMQPEQWAWWRKKASTQAESSLLEEFPWHEDVAWQATGSAFFQGARLTEDEKFLRERGVGFEGYRYDLGTNFLTMKCEQVMAGQLAELRIWERPVKNARYVMGADVAYGRSEKSDNHVISVWRCYADKVVQVAEWNTKIPDTRHMAWVLAHLAGSYRDCLINLEINGPGIQIMNEMASLRQQINLSHLRFDLEASFDSKQALDQARWFLYHRPDSPSSGYVYNWTTSYRNKPDLMNGFRDRYHTEEVVVRSIPLLGEMKTIVQNGVAIQASGRNKDDRPVAAALACYAWQKWVRVNMMEEGRTFAKESARQTHMLASGTQVVTNIIPQFFAQKARDRSEAELRRLLEN
jgi:hypothetical protein